MAVDDEGNVYVAGMATGSVDSQSLIGNQDMILVKFDTDGTKLWTRMLGIAGGIVDTFGYGVAVDTAGNEQPILPPWKP